MNIKVKLSRPLQAEHFFLIVALFFGVLYSLITPPFRAPDEVRHFMRLYDLAQGNMFGDMSQTPERLISFIHDIRANCPRTLSAWYVDCIADRRHVRADGATYAIPVWFASAYTPLSYVAGIPVMVIADLFEVPLLYSLYAVRLSMMFFSVWLIFLGIRMLPWWKWQVAFFFLFSSQIFIRSNISADGATAGVALILIAVSLSQPRIQASAGHFWHAGLAVALGLLKMAYAPIAWLLITRAQWLRTVLLFAIFPCVAGLIWAFSMPEILESSYHAEDMLVAQHPDFYQRNKNFIEDFYMDGNKIAHYEDRDKRDVVILPWQQFDYLLHNPHHIPLIAINTIESYSVFWIKNMTNIIGKSREVVTIVPPLLYIILLLMLRNDKDIQNSQRDKIFYTGLFMLVFAGIAMGMYLSFSTVGAPLVTGIQGRYFVPLMPLLLVLVPKGRAHTSKYHDGVCIALMLALSAAFASYLHLEYGVYNSFLISRIAPSFI